MHHTMQSPFFFCCSVQHVLLAILIIFSAQASFLRVSNISFQKVSVPKLFFKKKSSIRYPTTNQQITQSHIPHLRLHFFRYLRHCKTSLNIFSLTLHRLRTKTGSNVASFLKAEDKKQYENTILNLSSPRGYRHTMPQNNACKRSACTDCTK